MSPGGIGAVVSRHRDSEVQRTAKGLANGDGPENGRDSEDGEEWFRLHESAGVLIGLFQNAILK